MAPVNCPVRRRRRPSRLRVGTEVVMHAAVSVQTVRVVHGDRAVLVVLVVVVVVVVDVRVRAKGKRTAKLC